MNLDFLINGKHGLADSSLITVDIYTIISRIVNLGTGKAIAKRYKIKN